MQTDGRADRHDEDNSHFSQFANAPTNVAKLTSDYICVSIGFFLSVNLIVSLKVSKCGAGERWRSLGPIV